MSNGGGGLFLDDRNGKKSALIDPSTPPRSRSRTPDDIWGEGDGDLVAPKEEEEGDRYNENGSAVKKRKIESESDSPRTDQAKDEASATTPAPAKSRQVSGPFIDESDSEEDLGAFGDFGDEPAVLATAEDVKDATGANNDRKDDDRTSDVAVPPLVREATSLIEDNELANFDDLEENEFGGEEGLLDQENDDAEGIEKTVFCFDDSNDSPAPEECDVDPGNGVAVCPICEIELVGLSDVVRRSFGLDYVRVVG